MSNSLRPFDDVMQQSLKKLDTLNILQTKYFDLAKNTESSNTGPFSAFFVFNITFPLKNLSAITYHKTNKMGELFKFLIT